MRIGNLWGLSAPMAIIVFDGNYEMLWDKISYLNTETNSHLLRCVKKEFIALLKSVENSGWTLPEFSTVSGRFAETTVVRKMKIDGASEIDNSVFLLEACYKILEKIIDFEEKGDYRKLPSDLKSFVLDTFPQEFTLSSFNRVVRKAAKGMGSAAFSNIHELSAEFSLEEKVPASIWHGGKKVELDENMAAVWKYFHERTDSIRECINRCSSKQTDEETIFGLSFFDLIKRKPISIKYSVMDAFQRIKDRQYVHLLPECRDTCRAEIDKFRKALLQNVDFENDCLNDNFDGEEIDMLLSDSSTQCRLFFENLQVSGELLFSDIRSADMKLLIEIFSLIDRTDKQNVAGILGVNTDDFDSFCEQCCDIGIYGINSSSMALFQDTVTNTLFSKRGKIKKSKEDLEELTRHLMDINAFLNTLLPIGTSIRSEEEIL
jgi:hypothetical protein